ncbi:MAG: hypothetical protein H6843_08470 [Rhodospirillaceae bacterium]|nr:hypothetical protein [Rhodospirillaceae bacterium]
MTPPPESPSEDASPPTDRDNAIANYKRLLQSYIDRRPSGTRLRIATALGTNKSFVTQIISPSYDVPLPEAHVPMIMSVCQFSEEERETFLAAYGAAHPTRLDAVRRNTERAQGFYRLQVMVPNLGDERLQQDVEQAIRGMADHIIRIARRPPASE